MILKEQIKKIAAYFNVLSAYDRQQKIEFERLTNLIQKNKPYSYNNGATFILFSKDRALQLELLLRSYFELVAHPVQLKILYHSGNQYFEQGYKKLREQYANHSTIEWVREKNFRSDLKELFKKLTTEKVIFMVDDLFFKEKLNLEKFIQFNTNENVASLRLGTHLNFSYTLQKQQRLPSFTQDDEFYTWNWHQGRLDWAYPLSVDGHLFSTHEMKILVEELDYKAPNSFEAALQIMNPLYKKRKGVCFADSKIVNNPCNKVQSEHGNVHGTLNATVLNQKWLKGYRIQLEPLLGIKNTSAHQEIPLTFEKND